MGVWARRFGILSASSLLALAVTMAAAYIMVCEFTKAVE